jgi:hypothetical protein
LRLTQIAEIEQAQAQQFQQAGFIPQKQANQQSQRSFPPLS